MFPLIKYVSWRHLTHRRGRTLLTLTGIVLGVAMIMSVFSLNATITGAYTQLFSGLAGAADIEIAALSEAGVAHDLLPAAENTDGIEAAVPLVKGNTIVFSRDEQASVFLLGVRPDADEYAMRTYVLRDGRLLDVGDDRALLLTESLAAALDVQAGDDVGILTTAGKQIFTVSGLIGAAGPGMVNAGQLIVMPLHQAQQTLGKIDRIDQIGLAVAPDADRTQVENTLQSVVGDGAHVGRPSAGRAVDDVLGSLNLMLTFASGISLFAAFFLMYNNVSMAMIERRREYGILMAVGLVPRTLLRSVLAEVALLGLVGGAVGVVLGAGIAHIMVHALGDTLAGALRLGIGGITANPAAVVAAIAAGTGAAVIAAYVPARHVTAIAPTDVLRPSPPATPLRRRRLAVYAALLIVAGATLITVLLYKATPANFSVYIWPLFAGMLMTFIGVILALQPLAPALPMLFRRPLQAVLGVPGRLAGNNLGRWPTRTATTVGALLVALSMLVGVISLTQSYRAYLHRWVSTDTDWDLLVSSSWLGLGAETPMQEGFRDELETIPGVDLASPERFVFLDYGDGRVYMSIFDMDEFSRFAGFNVADGPDSDAVIARLAQEDAVAVSRPFAMVHDVRAGDGISLPTPGGPYAVTIAAVVDDMSLAGGTMYMDRDLYKSLWHDDAADAFAVKVTPGYDLDDVRADILNVFAGDPPLTVHTSREFAADLDQMITESFSLIQALVLVALIVATLGIANTLVMTVLERQRELAELRALGATQTHIRRMVLGEAIGSGLLGSVLGALAGIIVAWVMVEANRRFIGLAYPMVMPVSLVVVTAGLGLILAPLAGHIPARIAARMPIISGMRVE